MSSDFGNYCNMGAHIAILGGGGRCGGKVWGCGVELDEAKKKDQVEEEEGA